MEWAGQENPCTIGKKRYSICERFFTRGKAMSEWAKYSRKNQ
jgi:hypothetical protein